jgi:hypothetical protein
MTDPIFAAIERHREALAAYMAVDNDDDLKAVSPEHEAALINLLSTKPATIAGCAAVLHYIEDLVNDDDTGLWDGCGLMSDWYKPISGPGSAFLGMIADTLQRLAPAST